jgi:hypothetical protein
MMMRVTSFVYAFALIGCALENAGSQAAIGEAAGTIRFAETYERETNVGGWTIGGSSFDHIVRPGGNPGAYLRDDLLEAPSPSSGTHGSSVFTGSYPRAGVRSVGIDLVLFEWQFPPPPRNVHAVLRNDRGTTSALDDLMVWADSGDPIPAADGVWNSYEVAIASTSTTLPAGWTAYDSGRIVTGAAANTVWRSVIGNVTQLSWSWGPPLGANLIGHIDSGIDNPSIVRAGERAER